LQLIKESKEVLNAGVEERHYWAKMVAPVAEQEDLEKHEAALEDFEEDLKKMLNVSCCIIDANSRKLMNTPSGLLHISPNLDDWHPRNDRTGHVKTTEKLLGR
jgi:hypothetical protein